MITDVDGNEIFVVVEQTNEMRSYEVVIGDLDGRRLVCVKRHLVKAFWRDGFYFCTYRPNYPGQKALSDRDIDNKKVYPFSYLEIQPLKGIFYYRHFDAYEQLKPPRLTSQNPWFGFMTVCCTPMMRFGNFTCRMRRMKSRGTVIAIDQWSNTIKVGPGQDLLAALCIGYVFDRVQGQPLVTVVGRDEDEELEDDDASIESDEELMMNDASKKREVEVTNMPNDDELSQRTGRSGKQANGYRDRPPAHAFPEYHDDDVDTDGQNNDGAHRQQQQDGQQEDEGQPDYYQDEGNPNYYQQGEDHEPIVDPYGSPNRRPHDGDGGTSPELV